MASPSCDYAGYLQVSTEPFQNTGPTYYMELYGWTLYYWAEKSHKSTQKPISCFDIQDSVIAEVPGKKLAWSVRGPYIHVPVFFTAIAEREKKEWLDSMQHILTEHTIHLEVERPITQSFRSLERSMTIFSLDPSEHVTLDHFERITILGKGAYGSVCRVRRIDTGEEYAMKIMNKELIDFKNVSLERFIMEQMDHPFVVKLRYAFQTDNYLYIVMDLLGGGELFYHLCNCGTFDEEHAKFYAAEIGLAIGYLHSNNIIYRDLKPENVVLDKDGHCCLTDFGLAKANISANATTNTYCGTAEYQAPEILLGEEHGHAVDWWSLGIMLYEMLYGLPPFYNENENIMHENILTQELSFNRFNITISPEAEDLLTRLLDRDPTKRLQDLEEFKRHSFFKNIDFKLLYNRKIPAPFIPDPNTENNFDSIFTAQTLVMEDDTAAYTSAQNHVDGFTYNFGRQLNYECESRNIFGANDQTPFVASRNASPITTLSSPGSMRSSDVKFSTLKAHSPINNGSSSRSLGPLTTMPPARTPLHAKEKSSTSPRSHHTPTLLIKRGSNPNVDITNTSQVGLKRKSKVEKSPLSHSITKIKK
ncbi:unnamed protein product [Phytomonas sp. Hart1]|nr:unnamed protein product [Phytomonas sp. Hart1]|eukprot:CCW67994.1 unnamed protein product [Phytomonas sp. isolate Hart1]